MKRSLKSLLAAQLQIACLLALCLLLSSCGGPKPGSRDDGIFQIEIVTPLNGSSLTSMSGISGYYDQWNAYPITGIRLSLTRTSDGKYWDGNSWGGSGSTYLPVTLDTNTKTWSWQGTPEQPSLPAGADFTDGTYGILAIADYEEGADAETTCVFQAGITAPPLTTKVYSWGRNDYGQGGTGVVSADLNQATPLARSVALDGKNIVSISAGVFGTLAVTTEGRGYAWGSLGFGELGIGGSAFGEFPVPLAIDASGVLSGKKLAFLTTGGAVSFAISTDHQHFNWGMGDFGALGNGSTSSLYTPAAGPSTGALAGKTVAYADSGRGFTVVITSEDKKLVSWGYHGEDGCLGDGSPMFIGPPAHSLLPVQVLGLGTARIISVKCGGKHSIALTTEGSLLAFGGNEHGQLGDGSLINRNVAVPVTNAGDMAGKVITAVAAGYWHSLALDTDGKVYAWGRGDEGQLGNGGSGTGNRHPIPVLIGGGLVGKRVVSIDAGELFSLALTSDNKLFAWGNNDHGQLCGATAIGVSALIPTEVDLSSVLTQGKIIQEITCGDEHAAMLVSPPSSYGPDIEVEAQGVELTDGGALNFGNAGQGSSTPIFITVRNRGTSDLTGLSATVSGAGFSGVFTQPGLAPNGETGFYVFFQPNAAGPANGTMQIFSNDVDESPFDITLTGSAYSVGQVDLPFNPGMTGDVNALSVQPDGKVIVGGGFVQVAGPTARNHCARLDAVTGAADAFDPSAGDLGQFINCTLVLPDGKVMIGGNFTSVGGVARNKLARLNADGTLDTTYNALLTGTFGVRGMALQSDGRLTIVGNINSFIQRLNPDGTRDTSFNPLPNSPPLGVVVRGDGHVLIWGQFSTVNGVARSGVALLNGANGALDTSFANPLITFSPQITTAALQPDGKILVGGNVSAVNGVTRHGMCRLNTDGTLDTDFDPDINAETRSIALQADGSMIICGTFTSIGGQPRNRIAKLKANGALDAYFNPNANSVMNAAALQSDGKVLVSGFFNIIGGESRNYLARLSNDAATQSLSVTNNGATIEWLRGGASPETHLVTFDVSSDGGTTWTELGAASRVAFPQAGWALTSDALPATGHIRARAYCHGSYYNGSTSIMQTITAYGTPPDIVVTESSVPVMHGSTRQFGVVATGSGSSLMQLTIQNTGGTALTGLGGVTLDDDLSVVGVHQTEFQLGRSAVTSLAPGATTTLTVNYRPKTSGRHAAILRIPSSDADTPIFAIFLSGTGSQPITTWKQIHHGQTENTGIAADTADLADHDGNTELEEYAFNLNPNAPDKPQISLTLGPGSSPSSPEEGETASDGPSGGVLNYDYSRNRLALADVTFQVEWSDTLAPNDWHTENVTEEILSETATEQQIRATLPVGSSGRRFVRLKITR